MNNQVALFKISKAFYILSIGQIIAGQVLEGQVDIGNFIEIMVNDALVLFTVKALEVIDYISRQDHEVGLRVELVNADRPVNFETYSPLTVPVFETA
jgi:hypothetical protein